MNATAQYSSQPGVKPTIVLVHGAFADAASWNGVVEQLQQHGCTVIAPPNPLRGITADAAYVASVIAQTPGPVLAVGHSSAVPSSRTPRPKPATSSAWSTSPPSPRMSARP